MKELLVHFSSDGVATIFDKARKSMVMGTREEVEEFLALAGYRFVADVGEQRLYRKERDASGGTTFGGTPKEQQDD